MTESETVDPAVKRWSRRFLFVKAISIASMAVCVGYMLFWDPTRTDVAIIWLGLSMLFSFAGGQWCRWNIRRLDEDR